MELDTSTTASGELRRHLDTLRRRPLFLLIPVLIGALFAVSLSRGSNDTYTSSSIVRVPDPSQSSIFENDSGFDTREAERNIASAIQLIRGNEVEAGVRERMGDDRFDQINLFEVSSISDTFFLRIRVGSLEPSVAREGALAYADLYVQEQTRLDVFNLNTRAEQLRRSADEIDQDIAVIDEDLSELERAIVQNEFAIEALSPQLSIGIVPQQLVDLTIEVNDLKRRKEILLSDRRSQTQEQSFLRQEASNLDIEQSYRQQTGAEIVSQPEQPQLRSARSLSRDLVIFGMLGLMLGTAAALVREYFDSRVKDVAEIQDLAGNVPIVGAIPKVKGPLSQAHLAVATERPWFVAEAYRTLRTTLFALYGDRQKTFVISSVGAGAGKSVTVTNLAVAFAQAGLRTIVIDANLRRPSVHMKLGVTNRAGIAELLDHGGHPADYVQPSHLAEGLDVIPAGPVPVNAAELLGSEDMGAVLAWAEHEYDFVLVDSPPLDIYTDAAVVGHRFGGVFLVVRVDHTDRTRLTETLDQLYTARLDVLGVIVNGRQPRESRAMRYARSVGLRNVKTLWTDRPTNLETDPTAGPADDDLDEAAVADLGSFDPILQTGSSHGGTETARSAVALDEATQDESPEWERTNGT